jgi:hypothetical protein
MCTLQKEKGGLMNKGNLSDRIQVVVKHKLSLSSDLEPFPLSTFLTNAANLAAHTSIAMHSHSSTASSLPSSAVII